MRALTAYFMILRAASTMGFLRKWILPFVSNRGELRARDSRHELKVRKAFQIIVISILRSVVGKHQGDIGNFLRILNVLQRRRSHLSFLFMFIAATERYLRELLLLLNECHYFLT